MVVGLRSSVWDASLPRWSFNAVTRQMDLTTSKSAFVQSADDNEVITAYAMYAGLLKHIFQ